MFCTTSETEGEVSAVKSIEAQPQLYFILLTIPRRYFLFGSQVLACFGVSFCTVFTFCVSR